MFENIKTKYRTRHQQNFIALPKSSPRKNHLASISLYRQLKYRIIYIDHIGGHSWRQQVSNSSRLIVSCVPAYTDVTPTRIRYWFLAVNTFFYDLRPRPMTCDLVRHRSTFRMTPTSWRMSAWFHFLICQSSSSVMRETARTVPLPWQVLVQTFLGVWSIGHYRILKIYRNCGSIEQHDLQAGLMFNSPDSPEPRQWTRSTSSDQPIKRDTASWHRSVAPAPAARPHAGAELSRVPMFEKRIVAGRRRQRGQMVRSTSRKSHVTTGSLHQNRINSVFVIHYSPRNSAGCQTVWLPPAATVK